MLIASIIILALVAIYLFWSIFFDIRTMIAECVSENEEVDIEELKAAMEKQLQIKVISITQINTTQYLIEFRK